jgi:molecular chaperone GrpE (heat shock protein)
MTEIHDSDPGPPPAPQPDDLLGALARTRIETARLVRGLEAHRAEAEVLLKEINRQELDTVRLLRGIAGVLDTVDRLLGDDYGDSVELYRAGVRRTADLLVDVLCNNSGIELVGETGELADPGTHKVIDVRDGTDLPEDTVIKVLERGIRYRGDLIRPASVIVSSGKRTPS